MLKMTRQKKAEKPAVVSTSKDSSKKVISKYMGAKIVKIKTYIIAKRKSETF
jgi:hypothetical protein